MSEEPSKDEIVKQLMITIGELKGNLKEAKNVLEKAPLEGKGPHQARVKFLTDEIVKLMNWARTKVADEKTLEPLEDLLIPELDYGNNSAMSLYLEGDLKDKFNLYKKAIEEVRIGMMNAKKWPVQYPGEKELEESWYRVASRAPNVLKALQEFRKAARIEAKKPEFLNYILAPKAKDYVQRILNNLTTVAPYEKDQTPSGGRLHTRRRKHRNGSARVFRHRASRMSRRA